MNLVFSSVGDKCDPLSYWLNERSIKTFDLCVCYFGDSDQMQDKLSAQCSYFFAHKGSKFQNFHWVYTNYRSIIDRYDRVFIVDDDIIISTRDINKLFEYQIMYDTWILQPSFLPASKISHPITRQVPGSDHRFTNFVEVNVPLFSKYAIDKCMEIYDPVLTGYGIDLLFIWYLGYRPDKYMIVDSIGCINPRMRQINALQSANARIANWTAVRRKYGIKPPDHINFSEYI